MTLATLLVLVNVTCAQAGSFPTLPDRRLTPGVVRHDLTLQKICSTKWGKDARHVTATMKRQAFASYGLSGNSDPRCVRDKKGRRCEIDHLISRELGGADEIKNLWPQPYGTQPWNAARKDRLENRLHQEVCIKKTITLAQARNGIGRDWTVLYRRYFGDPAAEHARKRKNG
jgi:hypothetical protein